ncbi:hypothetical protein QCD60_15415 [Pokkaliibacter sp. MBI-7]|uniref:hypothetical protein n=1 Tax=Pokkaliibacter sp. MBI-7 TaxID=3040600 RepID=UPI00244B3977|nr:hypothetical protein [Pokkaliibacter sp. MBI-7]MDH2433954.1 hypothetical protein [Pokkaliibacter sp. MBI-7]
MADAPSSLSALLRCWLPGEAAGQGHTTTAMGQRLSPTLSQVTRWMRDAQHQLTVHRAALQDGHVMLLATSLDAEALGTGYALIGDWDMARSYWLRACHYGRQALSQATQQAQSVSACDCLRLVVCALAAGDMALARQLICLQQAQAGQVGLNRLAGVILSVLLLWLEGQGSQGSALLRQAIGSSRTDRQYLFCYRGLLAMCWALLGIFSADAAMFNAGVMGQLAVHHHWALGRAGDSEEEFICLSALAMINLGQLQGLEQDVFDLLIPQGLVLART